MKPQIKSFGELKTGDVFRYEDVIAYGSEEDFARYDNAFVSPVKVTVIRRARKLNIPGLSDQYAVFLDGKNLRVGCQEFNAVKAFKALGKALGYEVTG